MTLTPDLKARIDTMTYKDMLRIWRFTKSTSMEAEIFQGESGEYFAQRMIELRKDDPDGAVQASKDVGWDRS